MKAIINGKIILPQEIVTGQTLVFDKKIEKLGVLSPDELPEGTEVIDAHGSYVAPGFINIHIHGCGGADAMDGTPESLATMSRLLPQTGVTRFLPTTMTYDMPTLEKALGAIKNARGTEPGAKILGANLEGPFISEKYKGAQKACNIQKANCRLLDEFPDLIRYITLAPEALDRMDFIRECRKRGILVSLGHSDATYEEAAAAVAAGASHITHLYNAMSPLHHRRPGLVGAALTLPVTCELIADGIHSHPAALKLAYLAKGPDTIILITDSMRACLMPEGVSELGGQTVYVKDGRATLKDGTIAGSIVTMDRALATFQKATDCPLPELISLVTVNPAKELGLYGQLGSLEEGKLADVVMMDAEFHIKMTFVEGENYTKKEL